jgi:hypothetical protein
MTIYFDMDGTLANLYSVENWLPKLRASDPSPYAEAEPLQNLRLLARLLNQLQCDGYRIGIITWLSKESTHEYDEAVRKAKRRWLAQHLSSVDWDEVHMVKYGTPKNKFCKTELDILFDDEQKNVERWSGQAFYPEKIFEILKSL